MKNTLSLPIIIISLIFISCEKKAETTPQSHTKITQEISLDISASKYYGKYNIEPIDTIELNNNAGTVIIYNADIDLRYTQFLVECQNDVDDIKIFWNGSLIGSATTNKQDRIWVSISPTINLKFKNKYVHVNNPTSFISRTLDLDFQVKGNKSTY